MVYTQKSQSEKTAIFKRVTAHKKSNEHNTQNQGAVAGVPLYLKPLPNAGAQPHLKLSSPGDPYEQEADLVANHVMRLPGPKVQRQEMEEEEEELQAYEEGEGQTTEAEESTPILESVPTRDAGELGEEEPIQTKKYSNASCQVTPKLASDIRSLKGSGQPLAASERAFYEPCFGRRFNNVRLHTDRRAEDIAKSIYAKAFTYGRNIVFGAGHYNSQSNEGKRLLAHELTHVVQQQPGIIARQNDTRDVAPKRTSHGSATTTGPIQVRTYDGKLALIPTGTSVGYTEDIPEVSYTIYHTTGTTSYVPRSRLKNLEEKQWPSFKHTEEPAEAQVPRHSFLDWDPSKPSSPATEGEYHPAPAPGRTRPSVPPPASGASTPGGEYPWQVLPIDEVTVVDESGMVGTMSALTKIGEVYMTDVESMVANVRKQAANRPIRRLNIDDHGNEFGFWLGDDFISMDTLPNYRQQLGQLQFTSDGFVHLQHCKIGQNIPMMRALALVFGVPIYAGTGKHNAVYRINLGIYVRVDVDGTVHRDVGRP